MIFFYNNGLDFYNDNKNLIEHNIIRTIFFKVNSLNMQSIDLKNYCIKVKDKDNELIALSKEPYNLLLFGDSSLISELTNFMFYSNLKFKGLQCSKELYDKFTLEYTKLSNGEFKVNIDMNLLTCNIKDNNEYQDVNNANIDNFEEICSLCKAFYNEALPDEECNILSVKNRINDFRFVKVGNKIVSIACKSREEKNNCAITYVYTLPEHRGNGYARKIVSSLRNEIINSKKIAYLNVDNNNPISSHIYYSIGFKKLENTINSKYIEGNIKRCVFAGGCFWCLANSFYNLEGVIKVISGYSGGDTVMPTYKNVKSGITGHKESILIVYDSNKISYEKLLKTYFESIDPFDDNGQFIDRGSSYQTAVFTDDPQYMDLFKNNKTSIEKKYNKEVKVLLLNESIFYAAEEEHQEFSLKNVEAFEKEEEVSGRKDYKNIKIE